MANTPYTKGKEGILDGTISWLTDNVKAVLVDTALYAANFATDSNLSDIPSGARVATSGNLSSKTATGGVADAADITFTGVTGATVEAIVLYKDTGSAASSRLIYYLDTATGLPFTPNTGDLTITWNNGANKIFTL